MFESSEECERLCPLRLSRSGKKTHLDTYISVFVDQWISTFLTPRSTIVLNNIQSLCFENLFYFYMTYSPSRFTGQELSIKDKIK